MKPSEPLESATFESKVEEVFDSLSDLPATAPVGKQAPSRDWMDKLRVIAQLEGFDTERLLGKGGMGAVVLARDRKLGRHVALKFLTVTNPKARADLKREAERASSLTHENVVQVFSWHAVGDLTFFSMEFVDGVTLETHVRQNPDLPPEECLRIIAEAAAGVAAAQERGILHRDIKPQNILISRDGRVKVMDFGLSSRANDSMRDPLAPVTISGTVGFMAPEQARGEAETPANDVFSLTATLYYALTGELPFSREGDFEQRLKSNQSGKIVPLYSVREDLPPPIYRVIARGLNSDRTRRFPNAKALREEILQIMLEIAKATPGTPFRAAMVQDYFRRHGLEIGLVIGFGFGAIAMFILLKLL